ncbi:hypothetical protein [Marivirga harenae]|nr:hypothetical protein [Marivirga harenae]WKV10644.1 hypothetical protein Q3Y49_10505 [Marivirga harenae]
MKLRIKLWVSLNIPANDLQILNGGTKKQFFSSEVNGDQTPLK